MVGFKGSGFKARVRQPQRGKKWDFKLFKATYRVTGRFTYSEILYGEPLKCCPATEHDIKSSQSSDKWLRTLNSWTSRPLSSQDRKLDNTLSLVIQTQSYKKKNSYKYWLVFFPIQEQNHLGPRRVSYWLCRGLAYQGVFISSKRHVTRATLTTERPI